MLFALPALSIAGLPPFSGFVGKFALVGSGIESDEWAIVAVSLLVSLLTMYVMVRIWSGVFWGEPEDPAIARLDRVRRLEGASPDDRFRLGGRRRCRSR